MPATEAMLKRSAELKRALAEFAQEPRFDDALSEWMDERLSGLTVQREEDAIEALDSFILQGHLPDGRSLLEIFADEHPALSAVDRKMLLGWQDSVEGIFEVRRREVDALLAHNLIDDLTYRVRANAGPTVFNRAQRGSFLIGRILPIADEWLVSGVQTILPRQDRDVVYGAAADLAQHSPELAFRNPEKLEQAWRLQREQRAAFLAFFGRDRVVVPGSKAAAELDAFLRYQQTQVRGEDGLTAVERAQRSGTTVAELPKSSLPESITSAATVGLVCDEVDGLLFLPEFDVLEETFAQPELMVDRHHREIAANYLEEPSFSPRVIERLATPDPEQASRVFQQLLNQPNFDWERDGEALLRRVKPTYYARPVLPTIVPLSAELAAAADRKALQRRVGGGRRVQQTKKRKRR
jgi:hypothetical protein